MSTGFALGRIGTYFDLLWFAAARRRELARPLLRAQLQRQIRAAGVSALPILLALAAITGAALSLQLAAVTGVDSDLTQRLLFLSLVFELVPMLAALVVVARSSAGIASELAVMHLHDEFTALRRLGVQPADYLLLPRINGLAIALPAVTACVQAVALVSGWVAVTLVLGRPVMETAAQFLEVANPLLALLSLLKSMLMGAAIGVIACQQGSSGDRSARAISDAAIRAVGTSLVAVFVIDAAFAAMLWAVS